MKERIITITQDLVDKLGFSATVSWQDSSDAFGTAVVHVSSDDRMGMLIGKDGVHVVSLEHVVRMLASRDLEDERLPSFVIDVNNYRKHQVEDLLARVHAVAKRVEQTRRAETLEPMNAYQRRMIHSALGEYDRITTESSGQEPQRRVVIRPVNDL